MEARSRQTLYFQLQVHSVSIQAFLVSSNLARGAHSNVPPYGNGYKFCLFGCCYLYPLDIICIVHLDIGAYFEWHWPSKLQG